MLFSYRSGLPLMSASDSSHCRLVFTRELKPWSISPNCLFRTIFTSRRSWTTSSSSLTLSSLELTSCLIMVHTEELPVELLRHILSFFADERDEAARDFRERTPKGSNADDYDEWHDLCSLCLVSRTFRELTQPLLFRLFDPLSLVGDLGKAVISC